MQDLEHLFGNRHLDPMAPGEAHGGIGSQNSFRDHAVHSSDDLGEFSSAAKLFADAAIARQTAGAGEDQVAESGEARHGLAATAAEYDWESVAAEAR